MLGLSSPNHYLVNKMEIKVLWGFEGDPEKLNTPSGRVLAGTVLDIEEELAGTLIGKGLAEKAKPGSNKAAKPKESKPAASEAGKPAASDESKPESATEAT